MTYYLAKAEPDHNFSIDDLEKAGTMKWKQVHNYQAINNIKTMSKGDKAFFYHTGKERAIAGLMEVVTPPKPDPEDERGISWTFDVKFLEKYAKEKRVSLDEVKASGEFKDFELVTQGRLSVMKCPQKFVDWVLMTMREK